MFEVFFNNKEGGEDLLGVYETRADALALKEHYDKLNGYAPHHNIIQVAWVRQPVRVVCCSCEEQYRYREAKALVDHRINISTCPSCNEDYFMTKQVVGETDLHFIQNVRWGLPSDQKFFLI